MATGLYPLAVGLAAISSRLFRSNRRSAGSALVVLASITVGVAASRPYLLPVLAFLTVGLALLAVPTVLARGRRFWIASGTAVITLVAGVLFWLVLPPILVGDVIHRRAGESVLALDAYHVDCAEFWITGERRADPVSPPGLWHDGVAPCDKRRPGFYGSDWTAFGPGGDPQGEWQLGIRDWVDIVRAEPGIVIGGRIQQIGNILTGPFASSPDPQGGILTSAPGYGSDGGRIGFPSQAGPTVSVLALATSFSPRVFYVWVILLPAGVWIWTRTRREGAEPCPLVGPLLIWPAVYAAFMGFLAPASMARYAAPAALVGFVLVLWIVGRLGERAPDPTGAENCRPLQDEATERTTKPHKPPEPVGPPNTVT